MPALPFDDSNKTKSVFDVDRLRFKETGDVARILILDETATAQIRHFIHAPSASYVGSYYACIGDFDKVRSAGRDSDACPACAAAENGRDVPVALARLNYMLNVAHYRTNSRGDVIMPLSLAHSVWPFGPGVFNKLVDRKREHGDLRKKDIKLTCTAVQYQQLDMDVSGRCEAFASDSGKAQLREIIKDKCTVDDLETLIARSVSYEELEKAVNESGVEISMPPSIDPDITAQAEVAFTGETTDEGISEHVNSIDIDSLIDSSVSETSDIDVDDIFGT